MTSAYAGGFSDPDLTMDEGGTIYDTGINLVNDSVFGSTDGGKSSQVGNPDCHDGDRPVSLPLFIQQNSGQALVGNKSCG